MGNGFQFGKWLVRDSWNVYDLFQHLRQFHILDGTENFSATCNGGMWIFTLLSESPHWCKVNAIHKIELLPMGVLGTCPLFLLVPALPLNSCLLCFVSTRTHYYPPFLLVSFIPTYTPILFSLCCTFCVNILINLHIVINILINS